MINADGYHVAIICLHVVGVHDVTQSEQTITQFTFR